MESRMINVSLDVKMFLFRFESADLIKSFELSEFQTHTPILAIRSMSMKCDFVYEQPLFLYMSHNLLTFLNVFLNIIFDAIFQRIQQQCSKIMV